MTDTFNFTREHFYAAKQRLSPSALGVWCYLADGYVYDKQKIAVLNGIDERSVRRGKEELERKGYFIDGTFYPAPQKVDKAIVKKQETVVVIPEQAASYKYIGQF